MPRLEPGRRAKRWKIKTSPDLWHPVLESKHEVSSQLISLHYTRIDVIYERVAEILDRYGVTLQMRLMYRSYAEELYRLSQKYSGETFVIEAEAISVKYLLYGADEEILIEIGRLFGLEVFSLLKKTIIEAIDEAKTIRADKVFRGPFQTEFEYDEAGNISKVVITDKNTGTKKILSFTYDEAGNVVKIDEKIE